MTIGESGTEVFPLDGNERVRGTVLYIFSLHSCQNKFVQLIFLYENYECDKTCKNNKCKIFHKIDALI